MLNYYLRYGMLLACLIGVYTTLTAQSGAPVSFTVSLEQPASQQIRVSMQVPRSTSAFLLLHMPVWSPGYYQRLDYARQVSNFAATDATGRPLNWEKTDSNSWKISWPRTGAVKVTYDVKAARAFVANSYLDTSRGYIVPASVCMYPEGGIQKPVKLTVKPYKAWKQVVTGLEKVPGQPHSFAASDFDVLYDSPLLAGNLDSLPPFVVKGVPHYFVGYKMGEFDGQSLMDDLKKITTAAADLVGDIPFKDYTIIGIGPGQGGIEHLNSTTISFSGNGLHERSARVRVLNFIAHEYFHHYNAKRIRPFELGPFDYLNGNRTNLLWIAEGLTVYYEYLILRRAGITTEDEMIANLRGNILAFEGKPGRLYQSLVQASYDTWSDGPFGRTADEVNKTISYYDKGPVVGTLLDFTIRHHSQNKKSLDDVMRTLYYKYYKEKGRGYTDAEFQIACEAAAGVSLASFFEYTHTTKELDYPAILSYAGLSIDTVARAQPGAWLGFTTQTRNDSLYVGQVDWQSPAWEAGVRGRHVITEINGQKATRAVLENWLKSSEPGAEIKLKTIQGGILKELSIRSAVQRKASFEIKKIANPDALQQAILADWSRGSAAMK
ncbi:MAG: M61 family metallopeptidase [Chitinophagaceae bacterium]|nr:M61 family metallopeptidase [Chitinophagaceae bacterium]